MVTVTSFTITADSVYGIIVYATTDNAPLQYQLIFDGGVIRDWQTSNTFDGLDAGDYTVVTKDASSDAPDTSSLTLGLSSTAFTFSQSALPSASIFSNDGAIQCTSTATPMEFQLLAADGTTVITDWLLSVSEREFLGLHPGNYYVAARNNHETKAPVLVTVGSVAPFEAIETQFGFKGIVITTKRYEFIEAPLGFRGINFQTSRQQFIESATGFKGVSFNMIAIGCAIKIVHK